MSEGQEKQKKKRDTKDIEDAALGESTVDDEELERVKQQKYDEIKITVLENIEQVVVVDPGQRMAKWYKMKKKMMDAVGISQPENINDPALHKGEAVYVLAKANHPLKDDDTRILLIEKSRGQGIVILPESASKPILGRVAIVAAGQQYSNWSSMEEKMNIKVTPDFKAKIGHTGIILAREKHPKDEDITVLAIDITDGGIILVKSQAISQLPIDIAEISDPEGRYYPWPQMAEKLGIEDESPSPIPTLNQIGITMVCYSGLL